MLIHKHIRDFQDVRTRYYLDPNEMSFYGVNITDEDVSARTDEKKIRNKYDKRKPSDNNKSVE